MKHTVVTSQNMNTSTYIQMFPKFDYYGRNRYHNLGLAGQFRSSMATELQVPKSGIIEEFSL